MDLDIFQFGALAAACVPVTLGLAQIVKGLGVSKRFVPLIAIVIGIGLSALAGATWQVSVGQGIIIGLSSMGLWSGSKATAGV